MSKPREMSESGVYHVTTHAVDQLEMFRDEVDNKTYLKMLRKLSKENSVELYAWCLMGNHVHLLPRTANLEQLSTMMLSLNTNYAKYYNHRYNRMGPLVTGRFFSKPVDTDEYLKTVVRYIHQNPIGPHLSATCDYRWSSYQEYIGKFAPYLTSIRFVLSLFDSVETFKGFHAQKGDPDGSLDPHTPYMRFTEDEALAIARQLLGISDLSSIKQMPKDMRDPILRSLRETGLTCRQIANFTGLSLGTISSTTT